MDLAADRNVEGCVAGRETQTPTLCSSQARYAEQGTRWVVLERRWREPLRLAPLSVPSSVPVPLSSLVPHSPSAFTITDVRLRLRL